MREVWDRTEWLMVPAPGTQQPRRRRVSSTLRSFFNLRLQIWNCQVHDHPLSFVIHFFPSGRCGILHNSYSILHNCYFGFFLWAKVPGCRVFNKSLLRFVNNQWKKEGRFSPKRLFLNSITYIIRWDVCCNGPELQLGSLHWLNFRKASF